MPHRAGGDHIKKEKRTPQTKGVMYLDRNFITLGASGKTEQSVTCLLGTACAVAVDEELVAAALVVARASCDPLYLHTQFQQVKHLQQGQSGVN